MSDAEQAINRLKDGLYNSDRVSAENPGGLGAGGHVQNFPEALKDVGLAAEATGIDSAAAVTARGLAEAARDSAQAAATTATGAAETTTSDKAAVEEARDVASAAATTAVGAAGAAAADREQAQSAANDAEEARDQVQAATSTAVGAAATAVQKADEAAGSAATAVQKAGDVASLAHLLENIEWLEGFLPDLSGLQDLVNSKIAAAEKGAADGLATLDSDGRHLPAQAIVAPAQVQTESFAALPAAAYLCAPGIIVTLPGSAGPDGHRIKLQGRDGVDASPVLLTGATVLGGLDSINVAGIEITLTWDDAEETYEWAMSARKAEVA